MRLITATSWICEVFPEGGVGSRTVEKWIRNRVIYGKVIDGRVFVDADRTLLLLESNTVVNRHQIDCGSISSDEAVARIVEGARFG